MLALQLLVTVCTLSSLKAKLLQPTDYQIVVDNELILKLLKRMDDKDEAINELRQIQQRQEATIATLRKDVDQIQFEKEQLKESFSKCEVAIKSLGSSVDDAEYNIKKDETNVSDFEYDNINPFDENMDSSNMSIVPDNPTKPLPTINHLIKHSANGPKLTEQDANDHRVIKRHAGTELVAFFAKMTNNAINLGVGQNLIFDNVLTNVGSAYNLHIGIFTAPVSGVYVFMSTILSLPGHNDELVLARNGNTVSKMYVGGVGSGNYDTSAGSFVLYLNRGDVVAVQNRNLAEGVYGEYYSYFSGFLLSAIE